VVSARETIAEQRVDAHANLLGRLDQNAEVTELAFELLLDLADALRRREELGAERQLANAQRLAQKEAHLFL